MGLISFSKTRKKKIFVIKWIFTKKKKKKTKGGLFFTLRQWRNFEFEFLDFPLKEKKDPVN